MKKLILLITLIASFSYGQTYNYTFDDATTDAASWVFTDPVGTGLQSGNVNRRWSFDTNDTPSTGMGPTSGQGGSPDGYVYTEASSPGAFNDEFYMEWDTTIDASVNSIVFNFYTNQRGNANDATCVVQTNENGAGWVDRGSTFGGASDPDKVATSGTQIWSSRSVDLTGLVSNASTRIRLKIVFPSSGVAWNNDYGIDTVSIVLSPLSSGTRIFTIN